MHFGITNGALKATRLGRPGICPRITSYHMSQLGHLNCSILMGHCVFKSHHLGNRPTPRYDENTLRTGPGLFRDFPFTSVLFVSLMFASDVSAPCAVDRISLFIQRRYIVGAWRSPVSALVWETRGRRFKSSRSDQFPPIKSITWSHTPKIGVKAVSERNGIKSPRSEPEVPKYSRSAFVELFAKGVPNACTA